MNIYNFLKFYTNLTRTLTVDIGLQKLYKLRKPIKPYAFIRVHNEIKTIDACFNSFLSCLSGGVIGFNSCTDGTKEYILDFCKKYPQFIPLEYPFDLIPPYDERYKEDIINEKYRLDTYYNFVWEKLPKNEWIIKLDADHIWDTKALEDLCRLPVRKRDIVILSRMNVHCQNNIVYINKINPIVEVGDHWILYNKGINFDFYRGWEKEKFVAFEILYLPKDCGKIFSILANWHFPIVKSHRSTFNKDEWIPLREFDMKQYIKENKLEGRIPEHMLDENKILENFNKFNLK
ncbi:hypothetical protein [Rodentibacter ratti]|uniref:hypothetical protein n=1 Tax=Rodentibacter ratti TaxID=1906745 RepID=UPI00214CBE4C|nr:hypothetical protein [Rodentibacter ratti]